MKLYQVNINYPHTPIWYRMTKQEFIELWQAYEGQWEDMKMKGEIK